MQYREEGEVASPVREPFLAPLRKAGCHPWVEVLAGETRPPNVETTAWIRDGRTLLFVVQNPGPGEHLRRGKLRVALRFAGCVSDLVDERTGELLGDGSTFLRELVQTEALFLSFAGAPPSAPAPGR